MPHLHRFYIAPETNLAGAVLLEGEEAHHALHVVRLKPGDNVILFDGCGREACGQVSQCAKRQIRITIDGARQTPPPTPRLTLAQAWLLREKSIEFLVQHGVELGVDRFLFFRAARSERAPKPVEKGRRLAIEACKQCGRLWLPAFDAVEDLPAAIHAAQGTLLTATMDRAPLPWTDIHPTSDYTLFIGPEGDFIPAELDLLAAAGARPCSLGVTVFRSEMAAITAATIIRHRQGVLGPIQ